jgi:hypothetical protein
VRSLKGAFFNFINLDRQRRCARWSRRRGFRRRCGVHVGPDVRPLAPGIGDVARRFGSDAPARVLGFAGRRRSFVIEGLRTRAGGEHADSTNSRRHCPATHPASARDGADLPGSRRRRLKFRHSGGL